MNIATAPALARALRRIEAAREIDDATAVLDRAAAAISSRRQLARRLRGDGLGHALHPAATHLPIGFWTSAVALDIVGGRRSAPAATALVAAGLASAVPAAASGLAEWPAARGELRRVGVAHAAVNSVGTGLYALSLAARLRGQRGRGVALAVLGSAALTAGAYLGGHMGIAHGLGSRDPALTEADRRPR
jgi:uncharacterized membrane protein